MGDVNDSGDELENSYAGSATPRFPPEDEAGNLPEDGNSQADLEELPEEGEVPEDEEVTLPGTPVSPRPGDFGTSSPEPEREKVAPEASPSPKRPQLPDKEAVRKRGRANNVRR